MDYIRLGSSGLEISPIAVGSMSFGEPGRGTHPWTLGEERSRELITLAVELGLNFFDTANVYSDGSGEEILGRVLAEVAPRDELVIATKVHGPMGAGPNRRGLSRKAIRQEVDASLRRLGVDYIDLLQIHRFDPEVPLDETLIALDQLVRDGKVLYLGASSMHAWRFVMARERQRELGLAPFVSMQNQYSLISREDERELLPYCAHVGVGAIPWSPLGRGKLTRPWGTETHRTSRDAVALDHYRQAVDSDHAVVDAVAAVAAERGVPMAQVAIAWLRRNPALSAPLIGVTKEQHLHDAVAALDLALTDEEAARLEAPYRPRLPELY
ncbi:aldo/keto reductase [Agromyces aerolatus]|uniref:aldo/keto reductase n=1 Tax=Agromyces sp. LY-1074 TaxID=3074080 RepID=UPI00285A8658|nr:MULTISPECIES: aldo/keto reductase [unclassified Agromyces]MDR5698678.1 aldo/keto reductase [Agromyces sp. LY-1074]MDR5704972.1 aldo/keto reductase [Agromyces sp. LY-1358]